MLNQPPTEADSLPKLENHEHAEFIYSIDSCLRQHVTGLEYRSCLIKAPKTHKPQTEGATCFWCQNCEHRL